jgi:crotonobetainyl-CoA:carnitine CoA-transferase CaiB-like acyl-CoA transferase
MAETTKPLAGLSVLDLTNVLSGPFCTHHLAHLGARVIKIERPGGGDLARQLGADADLNASGMGVSFLAQNAGKQSITLNLKHPEGAAIFRRLAASADVVVENFRPGVMDRLGVGAAVLRADRPELVYCAISGFGQDGPWRDRPAYDQIVQGMAGAMAVTGTAEGGPLRVGYPVADTVGGLTAAFAIAAALNASPRGCVIDISMLEATMATMAWAISNYLIAGVAPARHGNENPTAAPSGLFRTRDGHINIAANKAAHWTALTDALGLAGLRARPAYRDREARKTHRLALAAELEAVLTTRPTAHWIAVLGRAQVPAGDVLTVPEILDRPQIAGRGFLGRFDAVPGVDRPVTTVRTRDQA